MSAGFACFIRSVTVPASQPREFDVVICGGGLAGLTLALELRERVPKARVAIVEKQSRPLPEACHKVGESCVELGSYYLAKSLGLESYLLREHLVKNGLRFYCGRAGTPLERRVEVGPAQPPIVRSYQLDRGKLENDLRARCEDRGVTLMEGWSVRAFEFGAPHTIELEPSDASAMPSPRELRARWMVDASGRRQLIQRRLGTRRSTGNRADAAWFRVRARVKPSDLVPEGARAWHQRDLGDDRWLSTNHLMGAGYWVWLIPLSSGHTSIGIVTSHEHHAFADYNRPDAARQWLAEHEPALARRISDVDFCDFRVMGDYAYMTDRLISSERWACVGEAGLFIDPLYSPGTDFIAVTNALATTAIEADLGGAALSDGHLHELQTLFNAWLDDCTRMLSHNGEVFTHGDIFALKLWWDYFHYWKFTCQYYIQGIYRLPPDAHARFRAIGESYFGLNDRVQSICETWARLDSRRGSDGPTRAMMAVPMFPSVVADAHTDLQLDLSPEQTLAAMQAGLELTGDYLTELVLIALRGIGPAGAAEFAREVGLADWIADIDMQRVRNYDLPRRARVDASSAIARELERIVGRIGADGPTAVELLAMALSSSETSAKPLAAPLQPS